MHKEPNNEDRKCSPAEVVPAPEKAKPFGFISRYDLVHFFDLIQKEHPQTIALVLSYLEPGKASIILENFPKKVQSDIIRRIACMDGTNSEIIRIVELLNVFYSNILSLAIVPIILVPAALKEPLKFLIWVAVFM